MSYYIYINKSLKNGRYYVGLSKNVRLRLGQHNLGKTKSTKHGVPWITVRVEEYASRKQASQREKQIKRYRGGEAFKKLFENV